MKKNIVIVALLGLLAWREYSNYNTIQWTIQNTSDELLVACEARIDEIESKYKDLIDHIEDNCADMIEDAIEDTKQEILAQF